MQSEKGLPVDLARDIFIRYIPSRRSRMARFFLLGQMAASQISLVGTISKV